MLSRGGQVLYSTKMAAILHERSTEKTRTYINAYTLFNIIRMCKPYDCPPNTSGLHKATDSTAVKPSGKEVVSLSNQLGGVNYQQN